MRALLSACAVLFAVTTTLPPGHLYAAPAAATGQSGAIAGWAEVDITPPLGIALGGRGGPETCSTKVLDPLCAQVLYVKDAKGNGFALASFDVVGLPHALSDRIRTRLVQELGANWNLVVLNASHTHSGPYLLRDLMAGIGPAPQIEADYFKTLEEKLVVAARAAAKSMQPVRVEVFHGSTQIGINRRGGARPGQRAMLPDANKPFDDQVWVMKLTPENGGPPAVVFSCSCHAVIAYGFAYSALSPDFPGATRQLLREALGPKAHPQFVQGFAGDIRPRVLADLDQHRFRTSKPADLASAAQELSGEILAALKTPGEKLALDITGTSDHPFLPRDAAPPRQQYERMRTNALAQTNAFRLGVADYWLKRYDSGEGFARGDAWSVGLIRLADNQWIVHCGGEPCIEWRAKMSEWLAPRKLVAWGYSQEANTYLPTESLLPEGGYEVLDSNQMRESSPAPFAPGIERAMHESLLRQLAFIQAKAD
jgi:neutral ceramidase